MAGDTRSKEYRKIQKRRRRHYKFSDKTHPVQGCISFALGLFAVSSVILTCIASFEAKGNSGVWVGMVGVIGMAASMMGLILGFLSFRKKDIHYIFPILGSSICGIFTLIYIVLYLSGAVV